MRYAILFMLLCSTAFAYDTEIGNIKLTENQIQHLSEVNGGKIKGVCYWEDGRLIATSEVELTDKDKADILDKVKGLPDAKVTKVKTIEERVAELEKKVDKL